MSKKPDNTERRARESQSIAPNDKLVSPTDDDLPPRYKWLMVIMALFFALPLLLEFC